MSLVKRKLIYLLMVTSSPVCITSVTFLPAVLTCIRSEIVDAIPGDWGEEAVVTLKTTTSSLIIYRPLTYFLLFILLFSTLPHAFLSIAFDYRLTNRKLENYFKG